MVSPLRNSSLFWMVLALAVLVANAFLAYRNIQHLIENEHAVDHQQQTLRQLVLVLSTVKDAETGQRGYLITGNQRDLQPYERALAELKEQLEKLHDLLQDDPSQLRRLDALSSALTAPARPYARRARDRFHARASARGNAWRHRDGRERRAGQGSKFVVCLPRVHTSTASEGPP